MAIAARMEIGDAMLQCTSGPGGKLDVRRLFQRGSILRRHC